MARRLIPHRALSVVLAIAAVLLAACSSNAENRPAAGLDARRTTMGGLDVTITPVQLDADSGAAFTVVFDTHTGAPGIDIAANAVLDVDGTTWPTPSWTGAGPGGHHRSGTLRFTAGGPARGAARLTITGLDQPLEMTWQLTP